MIGPMTLVATDRRAAIEALLREAHPVQHLVLVRCEPGAASAVARALEAESLHGLLGTLAGDDTVLVAVQSQSDGAQVLRRVEELL